jgi:subtilase family protein
MPTDGSVQPTGDVLRRVIVKFRDTVVMPYEDGAERYLIERGIGPWRELAQRFDGIRLNRLFTVVSPERMGALVAQATARDRRYRAPNLLSFFVIDHQSGVDPAELAAAIREWSQVETAYVDPLDRSPAPINNPFYSAQTYLKPPATAPYPAPQGGIDAEFAWNLAGGKGAGQKIVDLERGAKLNHEDLVARNIQTLHGVNQQASWSHGASVLGILAAVDNNKGIIGIAYELEEVAYTCQLVQLNPEVIDRINAVMAAIQHFTRPGEDAFGRVLLLEVHLSADVNPNDRGPLTDVNGVVWDQMPMETVPADFEVIRLATALGIVVVEAAGNGANDLDAFQQAPTGNFVLSRTKPGGRDSGAIMVAGSTSTYPYRRAPLGTGFGSRIDCFAWADNVCSSAYSFNVHVDWSTTPPTVTVSWDDDYPSTFSGTSSASAIVAGAVLLVQGVAQASTALGRRLSPGEMRARLSDPNPGVNTRSENHGVDLIGVMPNLKGILTPLGVAPDVYMRDYVGDTGSVPSAGFISLSPDIIVRPALDANPGVTFGPGTENDLTLGSTVTPGQDNFVYVRVWNRNNISATNVTAIVFYASVATLLTPNDWQPVGSVFIPSVPGGNVMTVSAAIRWPMATVPAAGHYCFIALVGNAQDPMPNPSNFMIFDFYTAFIRNNNNVTWKNFNVLHLPPVGGSGLQDLEFVVPGAADSDRYFELAVGSQLPPGSRIWLEAPIGLLGARVSFETDGRDPRMGRVAIAPHGRTPLPPTRFAARSRARCRLLVEMPLDHGGYEYEVYVSQLHEGFEVGRVTWRIVPRR